MSDAAGSTPDIREERRSITAVFADLVASTSLAEALDEAEVKLIVGEAVARIVAEVERLGGYVKDLAGDGVLTFFGAPIASEDDAERAVIASLAVVDTIGSYATDVEAAWGIADFGVRVGIATGPVVTGALGAGERIEYAAFGDTVNIAARLQAVADPGSVLADAETQHLVEPLFEWAPPVERHLDGRREPVTTHRPLRARPGVDKARGLAGVHTPLIGRDAELAQLSAALDRVRAGTGGVVAIVGEAGIGKTRLISEARRDHDGPWLEGRCVSYGDSLPYWPIRDVIRDWLGLVADDPELRVRVRLRRAVDELFGARTLEIYPYLCSLMGLAPETDAAARLADLAPEALQYRTFEVVEELLAALAADRPLIVHLEDLHWADTTSVQLVERLLAVGERAAVLLIVALRDERDHPCWALRERAAREVPHLLTEIALPPLSGDAERELLHSIVGAGTLTDELEHDLLDVAEGNPFYLEELIRSLSDTGALVRDGERWRFDHAGPIEIPATVERVVLARIDRLTSDCHDVLTAASALGRTFGLPLLTAVMGSAEDLDAPLHELQRLDLVRLDRRWPHPEFRFKHALIQDAAYRTLVPERRGALHRSAAIWLEERYSGGESEVLGLLARHWYEAGDEDKAVVYLTRAGDQARLEWSLDEAVEHYRHLLPLLERRDETDLMARTLFKLALALHQALRFGEANDAYARAFDLWKPPPTAVDPGRTLKVGMLRMPDEADPNVSHRIVDIQLFMAMFDRLVEAWPERSIVPSIAERWEISADGLRYVFRLRGGLSWSDGTPLTAHDVEFAVKRAFDRERPGASTAIFYVFEGAQDYHAGRHDDLSRIGVRALDDHTLEFRLAVPAPYFMYLLNRPDCAPHPRHAIEAMGDSWTDPERQVVSGAFRRVTQDDASIVLERRHDGAMPRPGDARRVELRQLTAHEAAAAYRAGELDIFNTQFAFGEFADAAPAEDVTRDPPAWLLYLNLRHDHPATGERDFRRALAFAVDREALARIAPPNAIVAKGGMVPPPLQGHTPDIAPGFDPMRAREALARSGVAEGVEVLVFRQDEESAAIEVVARTWQDVLGLRFPVREIESYDEALRSGVIFQDGWFPGFADPEYYLRLLLHSAAKDNHGGYASERFDELIERARSEPDGRTRLELFHAADRFAVAEDIAAMPLLYMRNATLVKPWVSGWWEYGKAWSSFADLRIDDRSGGGPG